MIPSYEVRDLNWNPFFGNGWREWNGDGAMNPEYAIETLWRWAVRGMVNLEIRPKE